MNKPQRTILGISLGTRTIGVAILKGNQLRERRVKKFIDPWSDVKLLIISKTLQRIIEKHGVAVIAIKAIQANKASPGLNQILKAIVTFSKKSGIPVYTYPLEELERYYSRERRVNKDILMEAVLSEYPELTFLYRREQKSKNPYFVKVFEAIAAAQLCSAELN